MPDPGTCIDCGTPVPTVRCPPCQRTHNDKLKAEHELTVRAMFRATEGHTLGRTARKKPRADRSRQTSSSSDPACA
jgi:hypothetical protein